MKSKVEIQYQGHNALDSDLINQAKDYWKQSGRKIGEIKTLDIYVKPEECCAYYSINNDEQKGRIEF
ncbi:DUF6465 family protein [Kallipyga massiliensis]|uniref:DUF6465 family protein n=1 Tax=Kallipyga massiliensis TaxID=1472764 RepID=UPI0026F172B6|nr:DUF6465 family protein [Kallipyga massiliensis]